MKLKRKHGTVLSLWLLPIVVFFSCGSRRAETGMWDHPVPVEGSTRVGIGLANMVGGNAPEVLLVSENLIRIFRPDGSTVGSRAVEDGIDRAVFFADIDGDGRDDLFSGSPEGSGRSISVINGFTDTALELRFPDLLSGSGSFMPVYLDRDRMYILSTEKWPDEERGLYAVDRKSGAIQWFFVLPQAPTAIFPSGTGFYFSMETRDTGRFLLIGTEREITGNIDTELRIVGGDFLGALTDNRRIGHQALRGSLWLFASGDRYFGLRRAPDMAEGFEILAIDRTGAVLSRHYIGDASPADARLLGGTHLLVLEKKKSGNRIVCYDGNLEVLWFGEDSGSASVSGAGRGRLPDANLPRVIPRLSSSLVQVDVISLGREVFRLGAQAPFYPEEEPLVRLPVPVRLCTAVSSATQDSVMEETILAGIAGNRLFYRKIYQGM